MLVFDTDSLSCLEANFDEMLMSDPVISQLFLCVCLQYVNTKAMPPFDGNFYAYVDSLKKGWLSEKWKSLDDNEEDFSIKDKAELVRQFVVEDLKELIQEDIEYKIFAHV